MKLPLPTLRSILMLLIAAITMLCFKDTLHNQFTLWDDDYYVTNNVYIRAFTWENLKVIFTEDVTKNNYHPLCLLSLAVNYKISGLDPVGYYFANVMLHIINALLVFVLVTRLCTRLYLTDFSNLFISSFTALWFAIHPMHVESVGWISERKDLLYTCFYLLAFLSWLRYTNNGGGKWFLIALLLFIASCLSKPMAVTLPLSLICFDVLFPRLSIIKSVIEKWPFFLVSLIIGSMAFYTQSRTGAVADFSALTIAERIMYASYGFIMYLSKFLAPVHLSTFYPYPFRYIDGSLPSIYYWSPLLAIAAVVLPAFLLYKFARQHLRVFLFGMGFFIANIIFVLQFVSVGAAIMADRYSYVAYIGLFFILAYFLVWFSEKYLTQKNIIITATLSYSLVLAVACQARTKVWYNSETLLSDAINKYPYRALLSYKWRGNYYLSIGELDKAMEDYGLLVKLHAADDKVLANIQRIEAMKSMNGIYPLPQSSIVDEATISQIQLHIDSVLLAAAKLDSVLAFRQYAAALRLQPALAEKMLAETANNYVQLQKYQEAIPLYGVLMKINTSNAFYFFLRGCAFFGINNLSAAVADWELATTMNVKDVQQSATYNLSVAYDSLRQPQKAYEYVLRAQQLGYNAAPDFVNKLKLKAGK